MSTHVSLSKAEAVDAYWYPQSRREEWLADVIVHAVGIVLAVIGCVVLVATAANSGSVKLTAALIVYSAGLLAMLGCSALYNSNTNEKLSKLLERFDLSGIFVMIAASYTPFMLAKLDGPMAWTVLAAVWVVALSGVAMNLLARWNAPRVYIGMYLMLGWAVLSIIDKLMHTLSPLGLGLLAAGGVLYTIGVIFHVNKKLPFNSAIWHGFVIAAASCHFLPFFEGAIPAMATRPRCPSSARRTCSRSSSGSPTSRLPAWSPGCARRRGACSRRWWWPTVSPSS